MKKSTLFLATFIGGGFLALMILFASGLKSDPNQLDLVIQGEKIPAFSLPDLFDETHRLNNSHFHTDKHYYLLNVWSSQCAPCHQEHAYLMSLSKTIPIYGINWQDQPKLAIMFLNQYGNPFKAIVVDKNSQLAIGLGVYGQPETFLVGKDGTIISRHAGVMTPQVWQDAFLPRIENLEHPEKLKNIGNNKP